MDYMETFGGVVKHVLDSATYDVLFTPALTIAVVVGGFVLIMTLLDRRGKR